MRPLKSIEQHAVRSAPRIGDAACTAEDVSPLSAERHELDPANVHAVSNTVGSFTNQVQIRELPPWRHRTQTTRKVQKWHALTFASDHR
jgi:hypothetical protein